MFRKANFAVRAIAALVWIAVSMAPMASAGTSTHGMQPTQSPSVSVPKPIPGQGVSTAPVPPALVVPATPLDTSEDLINKSVTRLYFTNAYTSPVTVMFVVPGCTIGATGCELQDGCPNTVANLEVTDVATGTHYPLTQFGGSTNGWFQLAVGQTIRLINITPQPGGKADYTCLQGLIVSFGQFNACHARADQPNLIPGFPDPTTGSASVPPVAIPNGTNAFECVLNTPGTIKGKTTFNGKAVTTGESFDITCVDGANCTLSGVVTPRKDGPYWNYNAGTANNGPGVQIFKTSTTFGPNSWVNIKGKTDNNCNTTGLPIPGVFPYGCSICNANPDPGPACLTPSNEKQFCAVNNGLAQGLGCVFSRAPVTAASFGGSIYVKYQGPLSPPQD